METEENNTSLANLEKGDLNGTGEERNEKSTMKSTKWGVEIFRG